MALLCQMGQGTSFQDGIYYRDLLDTKVPDFLQAVANLLSLLITRKSVYDVVLLPLHGTSNYYLFLMLILWDKQLSYFAYTL